MRIHTGNGNGIADTLCGVEKAGLGIIRFHGAVMRLIALVAGDMPAMSSWLNDNAKLPEGVQREIDVAFRFQLGGQHNIAVPMKQRKRIQKAGDKLAGYVAAKGVPPRR